MPKITRSRVSLFESPTLRFIFGLVAVSVLGIGGAVLLGYSDKGGIDVNGKISAVDQSSFAQKVNNTNTINEPNGGLKPVSDDSPKAPEAPQVPPTPEPTATSTVSSTTLATSSSTTTPPAIEGTPTATSPTSSSIPAPAN